MFVKLGYRQPQASNVAPLQGSSREEFGRVDRSISKMPLVQYIYIYIGRMIVWVLVGTYLPIKIQHPVEYLSLGLK